SGYYTRAMADRAVPDAFANDLTGVYATDPEYGANLIALMKLYNLYQFEGAGASAPAPVTAAPAAPATANAAPAGHQSAPAPPAAADQAATAPAASGRHAAGRASHPARTRAGHQGSGRASVPGVTAPALAPSVPGVTSAPGPAHARAAAAGHIPGLVSPGPL